MTKKEMERNEKIVSELVEYLKKEGMYDEVVIYYNDKRLDCKGNVTEGAKGSSYAQYSNDRTVTVVFEGSVLYEILNMYLSASLYDEVFDDLNSIFGKHKLHFELGDSWNLSLFD